VLHGFTGGQGDHGVADDGDADVVGKAAGDFFAVDKSHKGRVSRRKEDRSRFLRFAAE